jgi:hypothetical protein
MATGWCSASSRGAERSLSGALETRRIENPAKTVQTWPVWCILAAPGKPKWKSQVNPNGTPPKERHVMPGNITVGRTFKADDGGIEVIVLRAGSRNEKARFRIKNLNDRRASYTITIHRKSGADPDRIKYETDNPNNPGEYELSADETTRIEIRREGPGR